MSTCTFWYAFTALQSAQGEFLKSELIKLGVNTSLLLWKSFILCACSQVVKYSAIVKELEESENKLNEMLSLAAQANRGADDEDDLDAYMSTLKQAPTDKIEIKRMKVIVWNQPIEYYSYFKD